MIASKGEQRPFHEFREVPCHESIVLPILVFTHPSGVVVAVCSRRESFETPTPQELGVFLLVI